MGDWAGGCSSPTHRDWGPQHRGSVLSSWASPELGTPRLEHPLQLQRGLDFIKSKHENTKDTHILLSIHERA